MVSSMYNLIFSCLFTGSLINTEVLIFDSRTIPFGEMLSRCTDFTINKNISKILILKISCPTLLSNHNAQNRRFGPFLGIFIGYFIQTVCFFIGRHFFLKTKHIFFLNKSWCSHPMEHNYTANPVGPT